MIRVVLIKIFFNIMNLQLYFKIIILLFLIIKFCELFTNAVEHLGIHFKIKDGALGSIFAAIGTALPETVLPLIAVSGAYFTHSDISLGQQIGKGAILGSPFMLSSFAFFSVALWVCCFSLTKKRNCNIHIDSKFFIRDLKFFMLAYTIGILSSLHLFSYFKLYIGLFLIIYYLFYAVSTVKKHSCGADEYCEDMCEPLMLSKFKFFNIKNEICLIYFQLLISVSGLIIASHLFVEGIKETALILGISAMIISLFIAPVATELPEIINGLVWSSQKKDTLALSNITGAMVFQACLPMSVGIFFTDWSLSKEAVFNVLTVYLAICILLFIAKISKNYINAKVLLLCGFPYLFYIIFTLYNIL